MPYELKILAFGALLLLVHIFATIGAKTKLYGKEWNMGARDEALPPATPIIARLERAQANFLETLPIAIIAILGVVLANRTSPLTAAGATIWLGARIIYLPLYAMGVPRLRTVVYMASLAGLGMVLWPIMAGTVL